MAELAQLTGASTMTIRRDLDELAAQGALERYRGGARTLMLRGEEAPYRLRQHDALEAKQRVAAEVAALIADGESVLLDSGTTCVAVAHALRHHRITVMPMSLHAAMALADAPHITMIVPGGQPRRDELALTGPMAEAAIAGLRFDTAVLGCCALTPADGLTAYDLADAAVKRAAIASSRRTMIATDSSKLTRTALARVADINAFDALVTDTDISQDVAATFETAGLVVRTA